MEIRTHNRVNGSLLTGTDSRGPTFSVFYYIESISSNSVKQKHIFENSYDISVSNVKTICLLSSMDSVCVHYGDKPIIITVPDFIKESFGKEGYLIYDDIIKTEIPNMGLYKINSNFNELYNKNIETVILTKIVESFKNDQWFF